MQYSLLGEETTTTSQSVPRVKVAILSTVLVSCLLAATLVHPHAPVALSTPSLAVEETDEAVNFVKTMLADWEAGKYGGFTSMSDVKWRAFTSVIAEDAVVDNVGPNIPEATVSTGPEGFAKWLVYFTTHMEMKSMSTEYVIPGRKPGEALWFWTITGEAVETKKTWSDSGIDIFQVKDGKLQYCKILWGHPKRLEDALSP
mmetsp:Transcript_53099/g.98216  ORF Transcript_53099/g.98216 Transcript_53099/m.98216 type:complete len:201 (+) Transcript_53099:69-671(+)